jgi:steroid 5-alpha reductase family enzyme
MSLLLTFTYHRCSVPTQKNKELSLPTFFHSALTIAWGVRMLLFLLWREYVSWPALHQKVVELQSRMNIPFASRLLCWGVYSFFYVCMVSMSWSRLEQNISRWGFLGYLGLIVQSAGLLLESIADSQKNGFKSQHRHSWCNVGVWRWSTHPNYLGEGMFWWGSYLAHGFSSILHSLMATTGLVFITVILKGSTRSLAHKHLGKYGDQPEFFEFHRTHSIWGPKRWWWWLHGMEELSTRQKSTVLPVATDENTNADHAMAEEAPPAQPVS